MNGRSKRRAMLASALLGVTVLLGTAGRGAAAPAGNPYNLIDPSTISVASLGDAKPYTFTDANGQFTGFDVELFRDVAQALGVDKERGLHRPGLLRPAPRRRQRPVRLGVAAIGITDKRKKTVDFSDGYLAGYLTVHHHQGLRHQGRRRPGRQAARRRPGNAAGGLRGQELPHGRPGPLPGQQLRDRRRQQRLGRRPLPGLRGRQAVRGAVHGPGQRRGNIPSFDAPAGFAVAKGKTPSRRP